MTTIGQEGFTLASKNSVKKQIIHTKSFSSSVNFDLDRAQILTIKVLSDGGMWLIEHE